MAEDKETKRQRTLHRAENKNPGGMQVVSADRYGWALDWDRVTTVDHLKFIVQSILMAQYHTDDIRVSDEFVQTLNEADAKAFEEIFIYDR